MNVVISSHASVPKDTAREKNMAPTKRRLFV